MRFSSTEWGSFWFEEANGCQLASTAQKQVTKSHRRRPAARGLVRLEVQAAKCDAPLIKALAATLRGQSEVSQALRSTLVKILVQLR